jgi:hypothetical protein
MKKIIAIVTIIAVVFLYGVIKLDTYAKSEIGVYLNQEVLEFDVAPYIKDGRTMVPFRVIFEAMELEVSWNAANKTVYAKNDTTEIILGIGQSYSYVNGFRRSLDVPAEIINGRTFVPLRFVAENSGGQVNWNGETRTVYITYAFNEYNLGETVYFEDLEFSLESVEIAKEGGVITVRGKSNQPDKIMIIEAYDRSKRIVSGVSSKVKEGDEREFEAVVFASYDFKPELIIVKTLNSDRNLVRIAKYNL